MGHNDSYRFALLDSSCGVVVDGDDDDDEDENKLTANFLVMLNIHIMKLIALIKVAQNKLSPPVDEVYTNIL